MDYVSSSDIITDSIVDVDPTSAMSADATPVILAETEKLRVSFAPTIVVNDNDPEKSVRGKLRYERKSKSDDLFPSELGNTDARISRGSLHAGDWMEISLNTDETYKLYRGLGEIYGLFGNMREIPYGTTSYVRVDQTNRGFLSILRTDPNAARMIGAPENFDLVKNLLNLITQTSSLELLKKSLSELHDENLYQLTTSLNIEKLERMEMLMRENMNNSSEEYWQKYVFMENQWVLGQLFSCPCTVFQDKAYVGGKGVDNKGGNVCDFLYRNELTQNLALVEIKTPCTKIMGRPYRDSFSFSYEMSGSINQVVNYRDMLTKEYYGLANNGSNNFKVFSPRCIVVIGKINDMTDGEIAAFELYRSSLNNISIITFDELHQRICDLIAVLSTTEDPPSEYSVDDYDGLPF